MPIGGQFQEKFFKDSLHKTFPEIESGLQLEESRTDNAEDRVSRAFVSEGWHPIESSQGGEIVDVTPGNESGFPAFSEALAAVGRPLELDLVMEAAKAQGWDGKRWTDVWNLGYLSKDFGVELILEYNHEECYRFPGSEGAPRVRLMCIGQKHVGWVHEKHKAPTEKKGVHFEN